MVSPIVDGSVLVRSGEGNFTAPGYAPESPRVVSVRRGDEFVRNPMVVTEGGAVVALEEIESIEQTLELRITESIPFDLAWVCIPPCNICNEKDTRLPRTFRLFSEIENMGMIHNPEIFHKYFVLWQNLNQVFLVYYGSLRLQYDQKGCFHK